MPEHLLRGAARCKSKAAVSTACVYDRIREDVRCNVEQAVHHGVICARVLLANACEKDAMFIVDVDVGISREGSRPVGTGFPLHERGVHLDVFV